MHACHHTTEVGWGNFSGPHRNGSENLSHGKARDNSCHEVLGYVIMLCRGLEGLAAYHCWRYGSCLDGAPNNANDGADLKDSNSTDFGRDCAGEQGAKEPTGKE